VTDPTGPDSTERTGRRLSRRVVVGIVLGVVLLVAAGAGVLAYLWQRPDARPVSVNEAEKRLDGAAGDGANGAAFIPAEGVYSYTGSGSEALSIPPKSQAEGPEMPATVLHHAHGCWTFRIDYSTNHWQDWRYCARDGRLVDQGGRTFQRWDFVVSTIENTSTFPCDPPSVVLRSDMVPGETWQQSCAGTNTSVSGSTVSSGEIRFVGVEPFDVGGTQVDAFHFVQHRTLSGAQHGEANSELWFAPNGLPLRNQRHIVVDTDSPIGSITYTEDGTFTLTSLEPTTKG
jgi:hypothetical protein